MTAKKKASKRQKFAFPMDKVRALRWVEKQILAEPKRLDMDCVVEFMSVGNVKNDKEYTPKCGTQACIAGWYGLKQFGKLVQKTEQYENWTTGKMRKGTIWSWKLNTKRDLLTFMRKDLKLSEEVAASVFYTSEWPNPFHDEFMYAYGDKKKEAEITVKRIEHLIHTGQ
jgi:hypothetical protein